MCVKYVTVDWHSPLVPVTNLNCRQHVSIPVFTLRFKCSDFAILVGELALPVMAGL